MLRQLRCAEVGIAAVDRTRLTMELTRRLPQIVDSISHLGASKAHHAVSYQSPAEPHMNWLVVALSRLLVALSIAVALSCPENSQARCKPNPHPFAQSQWVDASRRCPLAKAQIKRPLSIFATCACSRRMAAVMLPMK